VPEGIAKVAEHPHANTGDHGSPPRRDVGRGYDFQLVPEDVSFVLHPEMIFRAAAHGHHAARRPANSRDERFERMASLEV
jgi:hypothetical protein